MCLCGLKSYSNDAARDVGTGSAAGDTGESLPDGAAARRGLGRGAEGVGEPARCSRGDRGLVRGAVGDDPVDTITERETQPGNTERVH